MTKYFWFSRFFLLAILVEPSLGYHATGSFWANPATREEADEFSDTPEIRDVIAKREGGTTSKSLSDDAKFKLITGNIFDKSSFTDAAKKPVGKTQNSNKTEGIERRQDTTDPPKEEPPDGEDGDDGEGEGDGEEEATEEELPQLAFNDFGDSGLAGEKKETGIHLTRKWTLPVDNAKCSGSTLCTWIVDHLVKDEENPPTATISTSFQRTSFSLTASFKGTYKIKEYLFFTGISLEFAIGVDVESKLELSVTMEYKDPQLTPDSSLILSGAIKATPDALMLEFSMQGFIRVSDFVEIGNVKLGGGISAGMPAFLFGITINLGHKSGELISIRGDARIDLGNPANNLIYASINTLTVERVCNAFQYDCSNVIEPIMKTGFPNGVVFSYAPNGVADLMIEGTFNVFGFESYTKLIVSTDGFELDMKLRPINWVYGMIQIFKEQGNPEEGPEGAVKLCKTGSFSFKIKGFGRFLSIFHYKVDIDVEATSIHFNVAGTIIPDILDGEILFIAGVASGANSNNNPLFRFEITVNTDRLNDMIRSTIEPVVGALRFVVKKLEDAFDTVIEAAESAYNAMKTAHDGWETDVKAWEEKLTKRQQDLNAAGQITCDHCAVCLPFLDWNSKCWKVRGHWVGCPFWNSCFTRIKDPICYMACALQKLKATLKKWANQALLTLERLILSGVQGLMYVAKQVLVFADYIAKSAAQTKVDTFSKIPEILKMDDESYTTDIGSFGIKFRVQQRRWAWQIRRRGIYGRKSLKIGTRGGGEEELSTDD